MHKRPTPVGSPALACPSVELEYMLILRTSPGEGNLASHSTSPSARVKALISGPGSGVSSILAHSRCSKIDDLTAGADAEAIKVIIVRKGLQVVSHPE
jgi:hypothetical protein